jgi:hypothetical protein
MLQCWCCCCQISKVESMSQPQSALQGVKCSAVVIDSARDIYNAAVVPLASATIANNFSRQDFELG